MKRINRIVLCVCLGLTPAIGLASEQGNAEKAENAGSTETTSKTASPEKRKVLNPWIDCGIGAMIFDETGWAAVTSNVIWDFGTTAVTSDQSSQHTCNSKKAQTALYIGVTYANLEEETVKGDGQHLRAMLNMMGCQHGAQANIINSVRSEFSESVRAADYSAKPAAAKAEAYYNIVERVTSEQYAQDCRA